MVFQGSPRWCGFRGGLCLLVVLEAVVDGLQKGPLQCSLGRGVLLFGVVAGASRSREGGKLERWWRGPPSFTLTIVAGEPSEYARSHNKRHRGTPARDCWSVHKRENLSSMALGMSMDQEIFLILGQVPLSVSVGGKKFGYVWSGGRLTRKLTSRPDHLTKLWTKLGKKCPAENETKVVT